MWVQRIRKNQRVFKASRREIFNEQDIEGEGMFSVDDLQLRQLWDSFMYNQWLEIWGWS